MMQTSFALWAFVCSPFMSGPVHFADDLLFFLSVLLLVFPWNK